VLPWADLSRGKVRFGTSSFTVPPYFFFAMNRLLFLLLLLLSLLSLGVRAQTEPDGPLQWVLLPQYQLPYHVPADWTLVRQTTDSSLVVTYFNPDRTLRFTSGKVRNAVDSAQHDHL